MNDNDIVKALGRCNNPILTCEGCPLERVGSCLSVIKKDAFDIIIRQRAEIERLEIELQAMRGAANSLKMHLQAAGAEAIKEFAERLEQTRVDLDGIEMVAVGNIDAIMERMTEETP